eukprot:768398-Hanusia_phi.AAC.9
MVVDERMFSTRKLKAKQGKHRVEHALRQAKFTTRQRGRRKGVLKAAGRDHKEASGYERGKLACRQGVSRQMTEVSLDRTSRASRLPPRHETICPARGQCWSELSLNEFVCTIESHNFYYRLRGESLTESP